MGFMIFTTIVLCSIPIRLIDSAMKSLPAVIDEHHKKKTAPTHARQVTDLDIEMDAQDPVPAAHEVGPSLPLGSDQVNSMVDTAPKD